MITKIQKHIKYSLLLLGLISSPSQAFEWMSNNIQYLHGSGYLLGSSSRDIITLEHSDGWKYGQNFFFIDTINHENKLDPVSWEAYGEAYSYFSASKITGQSSPISAIKDIGLTLGFNAGSQPSRPFRAYLAGITIQTNWSIFQFLQIDVLAYKNEQRPQTTFQITPVWELPFSIGNTLFRFRGFMDYIGAGGSGPSDTILFQPQLLLDVGAFMGYKNQFLVGSEYQYWHHKFGLSTFNESLPQALIMFRF